MDDKNRIMKTQYLILILIPLALITACGGAPASPIETETPDTSTEVQSTSAPLIETSVTAETEPPNCLGDEISPIGQSIADEYESASYEQVMTWFCNGAEFEDILLALETEAQTEASADEMLKLLADGFTWDEIWQVIGLTE